MENSYYSVISPEGCSTILFKDAAQAPRAAEALRLTAPDLLRLGIMDAVVPEPEGGAHDDAPTDRGEPQGGDRQESRASCSALPPEELLEKRYERFREFGTPRTPADLPPTGGEANDRRSEACERGADPRRLGGGARPVKRLEGTTVAAVLGRGRRRRRSRSSGAPAGGAIGTAPAPRPQPRARAQPRARRSWTARHPIVAPLVGTFYRAAAAGRASRSSRRATSSTRARRSASSRR